MDTAGFGKYRFLVREPETGEVLFATGFSSIYGEWETTGEARGGAWRTLHESQRFPEPRKPVEVVLEKRGDDGIFVEIHSELADPASRFVDRSPIPARGRAWAVMDNGAPAEKVDLLVLGDGYAETEMELYHSHVRGVIDALFAFPPFSDRREDFDALGGRRGLGALGRHPPP